MTEADLNSILQEILNKYFQRHSHSRLYAEFKKTKTLSHSIRLESGTLTVKISGAFMQAPLQIIQIIGIILFSKLFRYKIDKNIRQTYKQYINENLSDTYQNVNLRRPSAAYTAKGNYYNLEHIFNILNEQYFDNKLQKPTIGWSLNNSYRRLGFYSSEKNLLVISRIFDSRKTPLNIVEYLMFHEMLHIYLPVVSVNGRRRIHPPEFRKLERSFPDYEKIEKWIQKKRHRL